MNKPVKSIIFFPLFLLIAGCAPHPREFPERESNLQELCERYAVSWQFDNMTQVVTLSKGSLRAKGLVGSDVVVLNDHKIVLSASLKKTGSTIIVPGDFKRKVMDQLLQTGAIPSQRFREIVIDPGHGGKDPGARSKSGTEEKTIVLDIAQRLRRNLERNGIKVVMTRTKDDFVSLPKRTEMASQVRADLFISIHANASRFRNAHGMEIYYLRELDFIERNDDQVKENKKNFFKLYSIEKNSPDVEHIISDLMYHHKRAESEALASFLTKKTASTMNTLNRGSKTAGFFVLKNTLIPAILVEVGFLSNAGEERLLKSPSYRQKIADGLSRSILEYAYD